MMILKVLILIFVILLMLLVMFVPTATTSNWIVSSLSPEFSVTTGDTFLSSSIPPPLLYPIPGEPSYKNITIDYFSVDLDYSKSNNFYSCEYVAKKVMEKYGGHLIFIAPIDSNGAWVIDEYAGHFFNKIYVKELNRTLYVDYQLQQVFDTENEMMQFWLGTSGYEIGKTFDLNDGEYPPYEVLWHY